MTPKVRVLGRPEINHLAQTMRSSTIGIFVDRESAKLVFLSEATTNLVAEALEEFALTVTEP